MTRLHLLGGMAAALAVGLVTASAFQSYRTPLMTILLDTVALCF